MYRLRQIGIAAVTNFQRWKQEPKVYMSFGLGFVICFLLSNKVILFSEAHQTSLQMMEPFIWTFGDAKSILVISLGLLLLFSDIPNLSNEVPLFLVRMDRRTWLLGQILYVILATFIYVSFIFLSTMILAGHNSYPVDMWSPTAAILGYSSIGEKIAVPAFVKVLELSFPYEVTFHIFGLMLGYTLVLSALILVLNLYRENLGMIGGILYSGFGFLMNPEVIQGIFHLSPGREKWANILFGWISPLNHATYYMHNFGYDLLPRLWMSYLFFSVVTIGLAGLSMLRIRTYPFSFTGTQQR